jgi:uncharacterized repeat protein (TIGR01451 family)
VVGGDTTLSVDLANLTATTTAYEITLHVTLPPELPVRSIQAGDATCVSTSTGFTCTLSELAPATTVPIRAVLVPTTASTFTVVADVSSFFDPNPANDTATVPIEVRPPVTTTSLVAQKVWQLVDDADEDGLPGPGDTLQYRVVIRNAGDIDAQNVELNDAGEFAFTGTLLVPGSVTTTHGDVVAGNTPPFSRDAVRVAVGTLQPAESATITFNAVIQPGFIEAVANQGLVSASNAADVATDDPTTDAPSDTTVTRIDTPRLVALKNWALAEDVDEDGKPGPGDTLAYSVTIQHVGGITAHAVQFYDNGDHAFLGTTLVLGSVTTTRGDIVEGNTPPTSSLSGVQVDAGDLAPGEQVTIEFLADIIDSATDAVSNQGLVTADADQVLLVTDDPNRPGPNDATVTRLGYRFEYSRPLEAPPAVNVITASAAIPFGWRLTTAAGAPVVDASTFMGMFSAMVACSAFGQETEVVNKEDAVGQSGLTVDDDGNYRYVVRSNRNDRGRCKLFQVLLNDGSTYTWNVRFR